jgi:hypothetical protein
MIYKLEGAKMLAVIKEASLNVVGWPASFPSGIKEFKSHTVIVTNGNTDDLGTYCLPGAIYLKDKGADYRAFGLSTNDRKILIVQGYPTEEITDEDLEYFKDLSGFQIYSSMLQKELYYNELFRPVGTLLKRAVEVRDEVDGVLTYISSMSDRPVYIKAGSNRHKFIEGKSNFLEDPMDFYAVKDRIVQPDSIEYSATQRGELVWNVLYNRIEDNTIPACLTLLTIPGVRYIMEHAIELRKTTPTKMAEDLYWNLADEPEPLIDSHNDIDWDDVKTKLSEVKKNDEEGLCELIQLISHKSDPSEAGLYSSYIFLMFYMLLPENKVDFIAKAFNLGAK